MPRLSAGRPVERARRRSADIVHTTESQEQQALFEFLEYIAGRVPEVQWAFHPANGGVRHKTTAARLKREGVKRGVPDVLLPVAVGGYRGLACEMKRHDGRVTVEQEAWLSYLASQDWRCIVAWSWQEAARGILTYLGYSPEKFGL